MDTWANYIKQAVVSVESTLDSILENEETGKKTKTPVDTNKTKTLQSTKIQKEPSKQLNSQTENANSLKSGLNLISFELAPAEKTQITAQSTNKMVDPVRNDWMGDDDLDFGPGEQDDIEPIIKERVIDSNPSPTTIDKCEIDVIRNEVILPNEKSHPLDASLISVPVDEKSVDEPTETAKLVGLHSKENENITLIEKEVSSTLVTTEKPDFDRIIEQREQELLIAKTEISKMHHELELNSVIIQKLDSDYKLEIRKREELEKKLDLSSRKLSNGGSDSVQIERLTKALSEKEASVSGLLQEGEILAKEILKCNNAIKKYKKDKEQFTQELSEKQKKIDILDQKNAQLTKQLQSLAESEKIIKESQSRMNDKDVYQQRKISDLENAMMKLKEENSDLKGVANSFESQIKEMEERSNQENLQAQSAALEEQLSSNAALQSQLTSAKQITHDLQLTIQKITEQASQNLQELTYKMFAKEEELNTTIKNLERRLFQSVSKNDELLCSTQDAMAPLLLQITNLESQYRLASTDWKSTEQNLLQRCQIAEKECSVKEQKIQSLNERLEDQIKLHNDYLSSIQSNDQQILNLNMKFKDLEDEGMKLKQEVEKYKGEILQLEKFRDENLSELSISREDSIQEIKKEYREKIESQMRRQRLSADKEALSQTDLSTVEGKNTMQHSNLTQQAKIFKSQILTMESQVEHLEQTRDELTSEIINLQTQNEAMQNICNEHEKCGQLYGELEERYGTVLELLGEKEERVAELENDILDIKMAYKEQMEKQYK